MTFEKNRLRDICKKLVQEQPQEAEKTRDSLIPKLISGKLKVKEAEKEIYG